MALAVTKVLNLLFFIISV
uniref:Uncharacterized protein n=1 Tax=Rhizophora mucronata TaxID=61149 RepID=A0A2P2MZ75_RHIMU